MKLSGKYRIRSSNLQLPSVAKSFCVLNTNHGTLFIPKQSQVGPSNTVPYVKGTQVPSDVIYVFNLQKRY